MGQKKPKKFSGDRLKISSKDSWKDRFRKARLQIGLSQADVANLLGVTRATVSFWEAGINFPSKKRYSEINTLLQQNIFAGNTKIHEPTLTPEYVIFIRKFQAAPTDIKERVMNILGSVEAE